MVNNAAGTNGHKLVTATMMWCETSDLMFPKAATCPFCKKATR